MPGTFFGHLDHPAIRVLTMRLVAILSFQAPGKRAMAMGDYLRGHAIEVGEHFEDID